MFDYSGAILSYCLIGVPVFAGMYDNLDAASLSSLISKVGPELSRREWEGGGEGEGGEGEGRGRGEGGEGEGMGRRRGGGGDGEG